MSKSHSSPMRFTARNDYAFLSIVHPCTMERTSFDDAETRSQKCTRMYTFGVDVPYIFKRLTDFVPNTIIP